MLAKQNTLHTLEDDSSAENLLLSSISKPIHHKKIKNMRK